MRETLTPDLCVIGAGAGGSAAALTAARLGASVLLIDKNDIVSLSAQGGMPAARAFAAVGHSAWQIQSARRFGISVSPPTLPQIAIMERLGETVRRMLAPIAPERWAGLGARVIRAEARFNDPQTIVAGDIQVSAGHVVLAPGAATLVPAIPGLASIPYLTPDSIWSLSVRPENLAILGGGPYALDLAQSFCRMGTRVTVLIEGRCLPNWDAELADPLIAALREEGITIEEGVVVERVERRGSDGVLLTVSAGNAAERFEATHVLVAGAGSPRIDGLGLHAAGIAHDTAGIHAGADRVTANKRVSAIGDACARRANTSPDIADGGAGLARAEGHWVAMRVAAGGSGRFDPLTVPRFVPTDPGLAKVGLDEDAARRRHGNQVRIARWAFSETEAAIADRNEAGFVKVIANGDGRILGAGIVGRQASELSHAWSVALAAGLDLAGFVAANPAHGTLAVASREAAAVLPVQRQSNPLLAVTRQLAGRRR